MEMPQEITLQPIKHIQEQVSLTHTKDILLTDAPPDDESDTSNTTDTTTSERIPVEILTPITRQTATVVTGIIGALAKLIGDKCMAHRQSLQGQIDSKLRAKINEKKLALGLRTEQAQKASYQTEEEYEMSM